MENKQIHPSRPFATRADSFTDDIDVMNGFPFENIINDDDNTDVIIQCICGFGKGFDDDDAVSCDQCGTWQHIICYFENRDLPKDDESYLCVACDPRNVDAVGARLRMQNKLNNLATISDQIHELEHHLLGWDEALQSLALEKLYLEEMLHCQENTSAAPASSEWLDAVQERHSSVLASIAETFDEQHLTLQSLSRLADELNQTRRNQRLLKQEEPGQKSWKATLYTTACSLGSQAAVPHTLPPIKLAPQPGKAKAKGKKRRRIH